MATKEINPTSHRRWLISLLPWLILVVGVAITWLLVSQMRLREKEMEQSEFELRVDEMVSGLQHRMTANVQILLGVSGLLMGSREVSREEFHSYVAGLRLSENYPGIQAIGYAALVPAREKARHMAAIRAQGFPEYTILPPGSRDTYSSVIYVEPFDWRNRRAFGYDILSDPVRSAAAIRARDENRAAMTDRVILRQETDKDVQAGVLILVPVYRSGAHPDTVAERRRVLRGWVYSALRMKNLVGTYLENEYTELSKRLSLKIYSGETITADTLMYESQPSPASTADQLSYLRHFTISGARWTIQVTALPAYLAAEQPAETSRSVLAVGMFLSCLLAVVAFTLLRAYERTTAALEDTRRSNRSLAERTMELAESEQRVRLKLDALLEPEGNLELLDLADIVDCPAIQRIMVDFIQLTGMGFALLDLKGKVLAATGWQDICSKFHRVQPESARNCLESDTMLSQGVESGACRTYRCKNGMWDIVTPIFVGGKHVGNLFLGQFFYDDEPPDRELFREQARRFGFDEEKYLAAYDRVPRWSRDKVALVMHFYQQFSEMISRLSHGNLLLAHTLTEQKRVEEVLLVAKEQAEAANRAKSIFLANMSHEIRTPLNAILGFAQVLGRDPALNPSQLDGLATIRRSGEHLLTLINDILDLAKVEAGRMTCRIVPFDLDRLITETEEFFRQRARDRGVALKVASSVLSRFVAGDQMKLRQVLINLVGNAVKFTSRGSVTLGVEPVDHEVIRFTVKDTGEGIAPEEMARLFEPFSQTACGRNVQGGTGLGLALSTKYVQLMGGELKAESTPGRGSCFFFTLPLPPVDATETAAAKVEPPVTGLVPGQPVRRILIVDDQPDNRAPMRELLEGLNPQPPVLEIREAADGGEAVTAWEEWQPHVVFMDMRMPVLSGEEATMQIKAKMAAQPDAVQSVVIALTASAYEENRNHSLACGCDGFLRKPFLAEEIFALLECLAALRFTRSAALPVSAPLLSPEELSLRLAVFSPGWRADLESAVTLGDFNRITALLEQIRDQDTAFYRQLAPWAYRYDLNQFSRLLERDGRSCRE